MTASLEAEASLEIGASIEAWKVLQQIPCIYYRIQF